MSNKSNSAANSNSNSKSTANSNQSQGQAQGQSVTYNYTSPADQTIRNVPNVYAPALAAAGSEVCLGSLSAGGAAAGFGLTVGGTMVDQECQLRMNARTLATLGYAAAAREEMCVDPQVRAAMLAAGTPCAVDRAVPPQARAEYDAPVPLATANVTTVATAPRLPRPARGRAAAGNISFSVVGTTSARRSRRRSMRRRTISRPMPLRRRRRFGARLGAGLPQGIPADWRLV